MVQYSRHGEWVLAGGGSRRRQGEDSILYTKWLYEFNVLSFGLCNGPATFQQLIDLVLSGLQWSSCLVYLDDIIVVGRSFHEHLQNLENVFQRLRSAGLKLKPKKCTFIMKEVLYLGHLVSREGLRQTLGKSAK